MGLLIYLGAAVGCVLLLHYLDRLVEAVKKKGQP